MEWLEYEFLHNTTLEYLYAFGAATVFYLIFLAIDKFVLVRLRKLAEKTKDKIDDHIIRMVDNLNPYFLILMSLYIASFWLFISPFYRTLINYAIIVVVAVQVLQLLNGLITLSVEALMKKKRISNPGLARFIGQIMNITLWAIAIILLLSNFGINVSSLVAGLGIGGIAIGLGLQGVLTDLFGGVFLLTDQPFKEGDYVMIGDKDGVIKKVGLKTTRIETLQGEEMIIGNQQVASSIIQNFRKMKKRRIVFSVGVEYGTPVAKLEKIKTWIKEIIESQDKTEFCRCPFTTMGDFSLIFEPVYYIESNDYTEALAIQHEINLDILRKFEKEGVEIAFPTQTVHVKT